MCWKTRLGFWATTCRVGSRDEVQNRLQMSRSTFYRRVARFKQGGWQGLSHRGLWKPSPRGQAYLPVKKQVLEL
jgi:transposase